MHGVPVFRGTRVPVQTLFEYLEGGETRRLPRRVSNRSTRAGLGGAGGSPKTLTCTRLMKLLTDECVDERLRLLFPGPVERPRTPRAGGDFRGRFDQGR